MAGTARPLDRQHAAAEARGLRKEHFRRDAVLVHQLAPVTPLWAFDHDLALGAFRPLLRFEAHDLELDPDEKLAPRDEKYLRVHYAVARRWPRESRAFEKRQLAGLEGIRSVLEDITKGVVPDQKGSR